MLLESDIINYQRIFDKVYFIKEFIKEFIKGYFLRLYIIEVIGMEISK